MIAMSKKKPGRPRKADVPENDQGESLVDHRFVLRIPPHLMEMVRRYAGENMRTLNNAMLYLMECALRDRGFSEGTHQKGED